jgi:hypothetical protein
VKARVSASIGCAASGTERMKTSLNLGLVSGATHEKGEQDLTA